MPRIWRCSVKTGSRFVALEPEDDRVDITFDGLTYTVPKGSNLAAALLVAGVSPFRTTPVSGAPRAPYCMMGACFDCLVVIDGITVQACMTEVREGLHVSRAGTGEAV